MSRRILFSSIGMALLALAPAASAQQVPSYGISGALPAFAATPTFNIGTLGGAATDTSVQAVKTALGSPFQAGGNIGNTAFGISGTLPAFAATPTFNLGTLNGAATAALQSNVQTAPGTAAGTLLGVQGAANGVPIPVTGNFTAVPPTTTATDAAGTLAAGATGTALAASAARQSLIVTNTGANPMTFRFGATASATNGHIVGPGQTLAVPAPVPGAAVNVFSTSGTTWFMTSN